MNYNQKGYDVVSEIDLSQFNFKSSRYEIWKNGKLIKNGKIETEFLGIPSASNISSMLKLKLINNNKEFELISNMFFDKLIKLNDRFVGISIPYNTDMDDYALAMFRALYGATSGKKYFNNDEPYSCSIFYKNKKIAKIALNFNNSNRIIEFYN